MHILLFTDIRGELDKLHDLVNKCRAFSLQAVCFCGNIVKGRARLDEWASAFHSGRVPNRNKRDIMEEALEDLKLYKRFCGLVDSLGIPVLVIPGKMDAPEERYFMFMQQAAFLSDNIILLHENTAKLESYIVTGFGGELAEHEKEDYFILQYPRTETLFGTRRMRYINPPRILLFHTPPIVSMDEQAGMQKGSRLVNEVLNAVAPSFLFCGPSFSVPWRHEMGGTVVMNPGSLADGYFAVVDTKSRDAEFHTL
ncbi:metallophosphoesterase family protein [candidate division FCPU426 bacterium]|nr:metallophosphoesterase family protein [candidate division FCPU426 bacterium]